MHFLECGMKFKTRSNRNSSSFSTCWKLFSCKKRPLRHMMMFHTIHSWKMASHRQPLWIDGNSSSIFSKQMDFWRKYFVSWFHVAKNKCLFDRTTERNGVFVHRTFNVIGGFNSCCLSTCESFGESKFDFILYFECIRISLYTLLIYAHSILLKNNNRIWRCKQSPRTLHSGIIKFNWIVLK